MSLDRLNAPTEDRASGLTAPLIRAASHVGYILGYLDEMGEEEWTEKRSDIVSDMSNELEEANRHLRDSIGNLESPYISDVCTSMLASLRLSIDGLRANTPLERADCIRDLQNLNHNIAHVGSRIDRDTAGLTDAHEGRLT